MSPAHPNRVIAVVAIASFAGLGYLMLAVEQQWAVAAVVLAAVLVLVAAGRLGVLQTLEATHAARPSQVNALVVAGALALMAAFHGDHFALLMLVKVMLFCIACLGLNVQFGYAGVVNFAGAAFFGVGAYATAVLSQHTAVPPLLILLLGGAMAALTGTVLTLPMLRTRGHYAALITIAFGILFKTFLEVNDLLGGPQGLKLPGLRIAGYAFNDNIEYGEAGEISFYFNYALLALAILVVAFCVVKRLERSWIGVYLDAVRIDETAASVFGVGVGRWKVLAFAFGNFFAGLAGSLYAMMTGFIAPADFTFSDSLILVSIVILGGLGNPWSIIPAAALVIVLPEKLQVIQEYRILLFSVLVVLILRFRPDGLIPRRLRVFAPGKLA
ncbi:MAG: branched-chain amino acid ABC transporter permease [Betaproteobacteria bacterium]|nr:branched-chain amino acid ABC transporter permease [Betaproteobacteria bacterium]